MDCKKIEKEKREERAITLIALVITIIVLLILAGVTIAMLTGENGILRQANEAKQKTQEATIEEQKKLAQTEANLNLEEKSYTDKNNETITIPAGMAVSPIEGENEITKGLVSIDKNGNEWVFIEVPKSVTQNLATDIEIETALQIYAADYRGAYSDAWYEGCGLTQNQFNTNKSKMLQSIKSNGGFWIGRYEVGTQTQRKASVDDLTTPLVQQDQYPYNFVTCSQAQGLSNQLNPNNTKYTSSLLYGIQWDLILKYIESKGAKTQAELKTDSTIWGNYHNATFDLARGKYSIDFGQTYTDVTTYTKPINTKALLTTGASERNKALNIYDLAGNEWEWTLQKSMNVSNPCSIHGGVYDFTGYYNSSVIRRSNSISDSNYGVSFRPALY